MSGNSLDEHVAKQDDGVLPVEVGKTFVGFS